MKQSAPAQRAILGAGQSSVRTRLRSKQPAPAQFMLPPPALAALADEAWSELTALSDDSRRKHMHWVHVRTHSAAHRQPDSFTREQFWEHLCNVYKAVYPRPQNKTGSILMFGCVAKERHTAPPNEEEREEHNHAPCYTSEQHYWKPVAARSLQMGVKLHAARHDGYTMMYVYVKCPSPKKPVPELDPHVWHSEDHPGGKTLQDLLSMGLQAVRRFHCKAATPPQKRFRPGDTFNFVKDTGVRTLTELRLRAHSEATAGDTRLAEFCTVHTDEELTKYLDGAWAVHDAPRAALASHPDRVARLRAATAWQCTCGGVWTMHVTFVLRNNGEDVQQFCADVPQALALGACRGTNLAIIGPPGCGKSTVFDALDLIYKVCGKPERDNTFPMVGAIGADVLLWQEFNWGPKMFAFEDLLSLLVGERFGVRVPGKGPTQFKNSSPMFYTSFEPLTYTGNDMTKVRVYNQAVAERFKTRHWANSLPAQGRLLKFPHCGCCFARFILNNA